MKRELALILALCAFAAAMVPRERRAIETNVTNEKQICAKSTPCGWAFYRQAGNSKIMDKIVDQTVFNTYCVCDVGFECAITDDDENSSTYVLKCKKL